MKILSQDNMVSAYNNVKWRNLMMIYWDQDHRYYTYHKNLKLGHIMSLLQSIQSNKDYSVCMKASFWHSVPCYLIYATHFKLKDTSERNFLCKFTQLKMHIKLYIYSKSYFSSLLPNTLFTEEMTFIASSHIFKHHFIVKTTATFQKSTLSFSLQRVIYLFIYLF